VNCFVNMTMNLEVLQKAGNVFMVICFESFKFIVLDLWEYAETMFMVASKYALFTTLLYICY
jgi:hypothetical protein